MLCNHSQSIPSVGNRMEKEKEKQNNSGLSQS